MNTATTASEEFEDMFAPTSAEEAASQSNVSRAMQVVTDLCKKDTPRHEWVEGDNWMRFLNPFKNAWYIPVEYYEVRAGNKVARVVHHDTHFGDVNLLRAVQISLYQGAETKDRMRHKDNPDGFFFREHRKAALVGAKWENTLGSFAIVLATLGRLPWRKEMKYKESWGDALIRIPTEVAVDPTLPSEEQARAKPRWGAIFDPVDGRLIKCSFTNVGTIEISASFTPAERTLPLGRWEGKNFVPHPQYADNIRNSPNLKQCLTRLTLDQQKEIIRTFVPADLLPFAEKAMQAELSGENRKSAKAKEPEKPAAVTQLPVPAESPAELAEGQALYVEFVQALGAKFKDVGEETVRKLIKLSMVNPANVKQMASFTVEMLKSIAGAA